MKRSMRAAVIVTLAGAAVTLVLAGHAPLAAEPAAAPGSATMGEMKHDMHHGSLEDRIANAKSPHDHAMLADEFEAAAKDLDNQALKHERMAKTYTAFPGKGPSQSMGIHCRALAENLRAAAAENRELAKFHRAQAEKTN